MNFVLTFFLIGGVLIAAYRLFSYKQRNKISGPEQERILEIYKDRIIASDVNLNCHNWNPGIKNHHFLFNKADLHLTDKSLLVIPYNKSTLGIEKWTPIILVKKLENSSNFQTRLISKLIDRIEVVNNDQLKVFFRQKHIISSTVELNFKNVNPDFLDKINIWNKSTVANNG